MKKKLIKRKKMQKFVKLTNLQQYVREQRKYKKKCKGKREKTSKNVDKK